MGAVENFRGQFWENSRCICSTISERQTVAQSDEENVKGTIQQKSNESSWKCQQGKSEGENQ